MRIEARLKSLALAALIAAVAWFAGAAPADAAPGTTVQTVKLPMLQRPIAKHEVISDKDLLWVEADVRRTPRMAITEASAVVGMAARRYLPAGRPILARDLTEPLAVRKGDLVAIVYTTPFMTLTARGRALEDAPAGASVRTLNAHSKRTIEATAVAPGIVATRPISHAELAEAFK